jgi:hypothetical protein
MLDDRAQEFSSSSNPDGYKACFAPCLIETGRKVAKVSKVKKNIYQNVNIIV